MLAFVAIILSTDYRSLPKPAMSVPKIIAGVAFNVPLYAVLLFVPADKLHWWRAWMFLAFSVAVMAMAIFSILPDNADLLSQRAKAIIQRRRGTEFS